MANGSYGTCFGCGRQILWIKTRAGKNMPCNANLINYKRVPGGKEKIVTPAGDVVSGIIVGNPAEAEGAGYISHFATCPMAKSFSRKRG